MWTPLPPCDPNDREPDTMNRLRFALFSILACLLPCSLVAQPDVPRPYVVLVSLDAFRYDYLESYHAASTPNTMASSKTET